MKVIAVLHIFDCLCTPEASQEIIPIKASEGVIAFVSTAIVPVTATFEATWAQKLLLK